MKESDFLKNFAKALGAESTFQELEEKKQKEKLMLERLGARFGVKVEEEVEREVPATLVEQPVVVLEPIVEEVEVVEPIPEPIVENVIPPLPQLPVDTIVTKSVEMISKAVDVQSAVDKVDDPIRRELDAIKKTITDLHRYARNTSQMSGGGAGDVISLDHQTTLVSSPSYNLGRHDYYVGVNYPGIVNITIPDVGVKNGRYIIIKDESGRCSKFPIIVSGNVDNDPDGFILRIDNGGIQMIYRNGWRIV